MNYRLIRTVGARPFVIVDDDSGRVIFTLAAADGGYAREILDRLNRPEMIEDAA